MAEDRSLSRLRDMKRAISDIDTLLNGRTLQQLQQDAVVQAAFERFLERLSEASRHIPDAWKGEHQTIPWRQIADLGNHLRHAYHRSDTALLWSIYQDDLGGLATAVDRMLEVHDSGASP